MIAELLNILEERRQALRRFKQNRKLMPIPNIDGDKQLQELSVQLAAFDEKINNLLDRIQRSSVIIIEKTPEA